MGRMERLREQNIASAKQVNALLAAGVPFHVACKQARTSPATFRKYKETAAQVQAVTVAAPAEPKTLVARLLKSNLSSDDKIALLAAAYN